MNRPRTFYGKGIPGVATGDLKGKLIVLEGPDGSGRSTQIGFLTEWLERRGHAVEHVGLKRSTLVANELAEAKEGNVLSPRTLSLFYATDFTNHDATTFRGTALVMDRLLEMTRLEGKPTPVMRAHWPWQIYERNRNLRGEVAELRARLARSEGALGREGAERRWGADQALLARIERLEASQMGASSQYARHDSARRDEAPAQPARGDGGWAHTSGALPLEHYQFRGQSS